MDEIYDETATFGIGEEVEVSEEDTKEIDFLSFNDIMKEEDINCDNCYYKSFTMENGKNMVCWLIETIDKKAATKGIKSQSSTFSCVNHKAKE